MQHPSSFYTGAAPFIDTVVPTLCETKPLLFSVVTTPILGKPGPQIVAEIETCSLPVLLDTGADICVMSSQQLDSLVHSTHGRFPNDPLVGRISHDKPRSVNCFGGSKVLLHGPHTIYLNICGVEMVHPFYSIDQSSPIIIGYDLMSFAKMVIDVDQRVVYSHYNYVSPSVSSESAAPSAAQQHPSLSLNHCPFSPRPRAPPARPSASLSLQDSSSVIRETATSSSSPAAHLSYDMDDTPLKCASSSTFSVAPSLRCEVDHVPFVAVNSASSSGLFDDSVDLPQHLQVLYLSTTQEGDIDSSTACDLRTLLLKHTDTFAKSSTDLGFSNIAEHDASHTHTHTHTQTIFYTRTHLGLPHI